MVFEAKKFGNLGSHIKSGNTFQLYSYLGDVDDKSTITTAGYFNLVRESLRKNDVIQVLDKTGPSTESYQVVVSARSLATDVEVTELPAATASSANSLVVATDNFNNILSSADNTGQKALDTLDNAKFKYIDLDTVAPGTSQEARITWNPDDGTAQVGMPGGNVSLQIGQETTIRVKASEAISNGEMVYVDGADGNNPTISLASASEQNGSKTLAMATEDIANNHKGYVTTFGLVRDVPLPTATWSDGDEIFLDDVSGGVTPDKLDHPNFRIKVGYVLRAHNTEGVAFVNIKGDQWLKRFQSMDEPTGFDSDIPELRGDISFDDGTRTFTIEPQSGQDYFNFWVKGQEFRKTTAVTKQISTDDGIHVIYFDGDGDIQELVNPTTQQVETGIRKTAFVSILYWNNILSEAIYVGEERHKNSMDGTTHAYLHFTEGLRYLSGLGLNTFSVDGTGATADAQFGVDAGSVADEDIQVTTSAIASTTGLPVYYKIGATPVFYRTVNSGFSARTLDNTSSTNIAYNQFTGGAWQLTAVGNNDYVLYHIFATTEKDNPIIAIMGEEEYATVGRARDGALVEVRQILTSDILSPEIKPIGTVIYQANSGYANDINARIRSTDEGDDYIDWRSEEISRTTISTTDHGSLSGLGDDDHTQYSLVDGTRAFTGFPLTPSEAPDADYEIANKKYVDDNSATPGGSDTHVQYNDGGALGGEANFTYNKTTDVTYTKNHQQGVYSTSVSSGSFNINWRNGNIQYYAITTNPVTFTMQNAYAGVLYLTIEHHAFFTITTTINTAGFWPGEVAATTKTFTLIGDGSTTTFKIRYDGTNYFYDIVSNSDAKFLPGNFTTSSISTSLTLFGGTAITDVSTGTSDNDTLVTKGYIDDRQPVGSVQMYAGATAPTGWLLCNNAAVSRTTYAALYAVCGTTYGSGDGSTTFNLPDARGIFIRGAGTSAKLTNANSSAFSGTLGTYQNDKGQGHIHSWTPPTSYRDGSASNPGANLNGGPTPPSTFYTNNGSGFTAATARDTASPGTDGSNGTPRTGTETNPANLSLSYIIKY